MAGALAAAAAAAAAVEVPCVWPCTCEEGEADGGEEVVGAAAEGLDVVSSWQRCPMSRLIHRLHGRLSSHVMWLRRQ